MTRVSFDASEVSDLQSELRRAPAEVTKRNRVTIKREIKAVTRGWRERAVVTAGSHGKLYPGTIRDEMAGPLEAVTGPVSSMDQGGMGPGFEWGRPTVIRSGVPHAYRIKSGEHAGTWGFGGFPGQRVGQNAPGLDMTRTMDEREPLFLEAVARDVLPWW